MQMMVCPLTNNLGFGGDGNTVIAAIQPNEAGDNVNTLTLNSHHLLSLNLKLQVEALNQR